MPHKYSEYKLVVQQKLKGELIALARCARQKQQAHNGEEYPDWKRLFEVWPQRSKTPEPAGKDSSTTSHPDRVLCGLSVQDDAVVSACGSPSSSSDSSSSDNESNAEDEPHPVSFNALSWELSSGTKGRLHLRSLDLDRLCCSRTLHRPESGTGLAWACQTGRRWSPRCWASLPKEARGWWTDSSCLSVLAKTWEKSVPSALLVVAWNDVSSPSSTYSVEDTASYVDVGVTSILQEVKINK